MQFNAAVVGIKYGDNRKHLALIATRVHMRGRPILMLTATQNPGVFFPRLLVDSIKARQDEHLQDTEHQQLLHDTRERVKHARLHMVLFPPSGSTYKFVPSASCPPLHLQDFESDWHLWRPRHYVLIRLAKDLRLTTGAAVDSLQKISLRHGGERVEPVFQAVSGDDDAACMRAVLDTLPPLHEIGKLENHVYCPTDTLAWIHHVYELRAWYYITRLRDAADKHKRPLHKWDTGQLAKTRDAVQPPRDLFGSDAPSKEYLGRLLSQLCQLEAAAARNGGGGGDAVHPRQLEPAAARNGDGCDGRRIDAECYVVDNPRPLKRANAMACAAPLTAAVLPSSRGAL